MALCLRYVSDPDDLWRLKPSNNFVRNRVLGLIVTHHQQSKLFPADIHCADCSESILNALSDCKPANKTDHNVIVDAEPGSQ